MASEEKEIVRIRTRRAVTLPDAEGKPVLHAANTLVAVPATDQAWDAVNKGEADMEPPPGVDGQPFPPERVTQAEPPQPPAPAFAPGQPAGRTVTAGPSGGARLTGAAAKTPEAAPPARGDAARDPHAPPQTRKG